ncbi:MAG: hypothetical protein DMG06_07555 [Acidobacteria bacterium]|nr:MAG: hypothetical protein DMG06_07555 [Acidobacteriota bacterium]
MEVSLQTGKIRREILQGWVGQKFVSKKGIQQPDYSQLRSRLMRSTPPRLERRRSRMRNRQRIAACDHLSDFIVQRLPKARSASEGQ